MPEAGGPTTQSGVYYQNTITALYLGQLLGGGPATGRAVVEVRAEAPESVDDTVVRYADGGRKYIQAKESLASGDVWRKLWSDFHEQRSCGDFDAVRDLLALVLGEPSGRANDLRDMARRSTGATNEREWLNSLNADQHDLATNVERALPSGATMADVFAIFGRLRIEVRTIEDLESERAALLLPETTKERGELLRVLRDAVQRHARHREPFTRETLERELRETDSDFKVLATATVATLREAVHAAGSVLRSQKRGIGPSGIHVVRRASAELLAWLHGGESANAIAMVTDDAGRGKSVVMADVLDALEAEGTVVLGIKADAQLSAVRNATDIQHALHLPDSLERVLAALGGSDSLVLLIDQVDALSHNLAHDAQTLDAVLDAAARARRLRNIRIVLSCRAFDRATDRRLRGLDVKKEVKVGDFTEDEVRTVFQSVGIELTRLTPATNALLRTPLHLELFVWLKTVGGRPEDSAPSMLQDLYCALLTDVALAIGGDAPTVSARSAFLDAMTAYMASHQRVSIPMSHFADLDPDGRTGAWLASHGIINVSNGAITFLHQTFFDYLFARRFVDGGRSLVEHLQRGPQALRQRTELVQILTYARSTVPTTYIQWLAAIWSDTSLRPHLRRLVRRWFAILRAPKREDVAWAVARLRDPVDRIAMVQTLHGNGAWVRPLTPVLRELLSQTEDAIVDAAVTYLASVATEAPGGVADLVIPHVGDPAWAERAWRIVNWTHHWTVESTLFFERVIAAYPPQGFSHFFGFKEMVDRDPRAFARIAAALLASSIARSDKRDATVFSSLSHAFDELAQTDFDEALDVLSHRDAIAFVSAVLPVYLDAIRETPASNKPEMFFGYDYFAFAWREALHRTQDEIVGGLIDSLCMMAVSDPADFDARMQSLTATPAASAQWIAGSVYARLSDRADQAIRFLLADRRRLHLGKALEITMIVIRAAVPVAALTVVADLERVVLAYEGYRDAKKVKDLQWTGLEQYMLLAQFPTDRLSPAGKRRLGELRRKFPDVTTAPEERAPSNVMVWESPPIAPERAAKMSDDDWLRAIGKHRNDDGMLERSPRRLADILKEQAKADPARFESLLDRFADDTPLVYVEALVQALAEPPRTLVDAVIRAIRKFGPVADLSLRRMIAWALEKHPKEIPPDVLDLLEGWVHDPTLDTPHDAESLDYLNPDRGAAFLALMYALRAAGTVHARERRWSLYEFVASDGAAFLRTAAIEELRYELFDDEERALDLFSLLIGADASVLAGHYVDEFVRLALGRSPSRVLPVVRTAWGSPDEKVRERAAFLATIAAVSPAAVTGADLKSARKLVVTILASRDNRSRAAVTRVLARNIDSPAASYSFDTLATLLCDTSDEVRKNIAEVFRDDVASSLVARRGFLSRYASSPAIVEAQHALEDFLLEHLAHDAVFGLDLIERALPMLDTAVSPRFGDDLIRYVLRVLTSPLLDGVFERRAMDVFDALDERYGYMTSHLLAEWDRP
jgi:hypothetical protein